MFMATGFGIISEIFPVESRARALSISAMFVSVGSIAGPALGGLILQVASWNYIFGLMFQSEFWLGFLGIMPYQKKPRVENGQILILRVEP